MVVRRKPASEWPTKDWGYALTFTVSLIARTGAQGPHTGLIPDFFVIPLGSGIRLKRREAEWGSLRKPGNGEDFKQHMMSSLMVWPCHKSLSKAHTIYSSYSSLHAQDQNARNAHFSELVDASISDRVKTSCLKPVPWVGKNY